VLDWFDLWRWEMIVLFLVDTSASMNQRSVNGMTLLDLAKNSIENFMKVRRRVFSEANEAVEGTRLPNPTQTR
jgi:hypothetical protein